MELVSLAKPLTYSLTSQIELLNALNEWMNERLQSNILSVNVDNAGLRMNTYHILYIVLLLEVLLDNEKWYLLWLSRSVLVWLLGHEALFFLHPLSKPDWLRPHGRNSLCKQMRLFLSLWDAHKNTVSDIHLAVSCRIYSRCLDLHNKKPITLSCCHITALSSSPAIWSTLASATARATPAVRTDGTESGDKLAP